MARPHGDTLCSFSTELHLQHSLNLVNTLFCRIVSPHVVTKTVFYTCRRQELLGNGLRPCGCTKAAAGRAIAERSSVSDEINSRFSITGIRAVLDAESSSYGVAALPRPPALSAVPVKPRQKRELPPAKRGSRLRPRSRSAAKFEKRYWLTQAQRMSRKTRRNAAGDPSPKYRAHGKARRTPPFSGEFSGWQNDL